MSLSLFRLGVVAAAARAAASSTDPHFSSVVLLLHADGAAGSTAVIDSSSSPKTDLTAQADAQISTTVKKFGTGSFAFDGTGDVLATPAASGIPVWAQLQSVDATIECWVYLNNRDTNMVLWTTRNEGIGTSGMNWFIDTAGKIVVYNDASIVLAGVNIIPTGQWVHLALVKRLVSGTWTWTHFIDGVLDVSLGGYLTYGVPSGFGLNIGGVAGVGAYLNGYIDEYRVTKGVARYLANFTPPTAPFGGA